MSEETPVIFVGTMHCGEGDYSECTKAILGQQGVNVKHVVIANQPEKEAHNRLWQAWRDVQHSGFDMFIKVDADTVLAHPHVLREFWQMMQDNPRITGIQAPLLDYFTDCHINGLNCFSPKVTFRDTADALFCDRQVDVNHDIVVKAEGVPMTLRPAGFHCYHATDEQAFHFGLHRKMKGQTQIIDQVEQAWRRHGDRTRALALLGAQYAGTFKTGGFNYNDERFKTAFDTVMHRYDDLVSTL